MPRPIATRINPRRLFPPAVAALLLFAFLPLRATRWLNWFSDLTIRLVAPVSHPVAQFARWINPADPDPDPADLARLREELDGFRTLYFRERSRNAELHRRIEELQQGLSLNPDIAVRVRTAPVIGSSTDASGAILRVRLGSDVGVDPGAVATVGGTQLLGKVVAVSSELCQVRPITDRASGPLLARVILTPDGDGPLCTLRPIGNGALKGPVEDISANPRLASIGLAPGQEVRLDDDAWPASAAMLTIGTITSIEPASDSPLRRIITVTPRVDLSRVSEVVLRIPEEPSP